MARISALCFFVIFACINASGAVVEDSFGRHVNVPDNVRHVVAVSSSMAFVTYLRAQDMVVGVEDVDKQGSSLKPYVQVNLKRFKDLPVIGMGGAGRKANYEKIISLKPDVILTVPSDIADAELLHKKLNIPVIALSYGLNGFEQAEFIRSIRIAGDVLGKREQSEQLISYIESLGKRLNRNPAEKAEAFIGGLSYRGGRGFVSTAGAYMPMQLAGITNIADAYGKKGQFFVNYEFILSKNPEILFIDGSGLALVADDAAKRQDYYNRLKAFKAGKVFLLLPNSSYQINPELLFINAFLMAKSAYPDKYADVNPNKIADEVLTAFNGVPLYGFYEKKTGGYGSLRLTEKGLELIR